MAKKTVASFREELGRIYGDAGYFIDAITSEYGFYGAFTEALKNGKATVDMHRKTITKTIEPQWVEAIEACLPALDTVIRNPSRSIVEREEILPIEFSHNINSRSIRHLAQHTNLINKVENGEVTPSKLLNVFNEETLETYENRFVNTLIQRLYVFVDRRYSTMKKHGLCESAAAINFSGDFIIGSTTGKIGFSLELDAPSAEQPESDLFDRVKHLYDIIAKFMSSDFVIGMQDALIRPPVLRTNAITKNKNLRQCLDLWDYIESYDKLGYAIEVEQNADKPNNELIERLYSLLAIQYMVFTYNVNAAVSDRTLKKHDYTDFVQPELITKLKHVESDEYNVYDSEYRRIVITDSVTSQRRLSAGEIKMREALDDALEADREIEHRAAEAVREEKRRLQLELREAREAEKRERKKEQARLKKQKERERERARQQKLREREREKARRERLKLKNKKRNNKK